MMRSDSDKASRLVCALVQLGSGLLTTLNSPVVTLKLQPLSRLVDGNMQCDTSRVNMLSQQGLSHMTQHREEKSQIFILWSR